VECDAVHIDGGHIRLEHEALADYLRAKSIVEEPTDKMQQTLIGVPIVADSWFPVR
jgi:hypothetical protein